MRGNPFTPEELVEVLKRSNLPTVLVEGADDIEVYRHFEDKIGIRKIDFIACGGRNSLLKIFERRDEFASKKVMYIADKDMWVFTSLPAEYQSIVFTTGYCIENDLYMDGENLISNLFNESERLRIKQILSGVLPWFAFEVDKFLQDEFYNARFSDVTLLNTSVLDRNSNCLTVDFLTDRNFASPKTDTLTDLDNNMKVKFRGKFLFQIFELIFQSRTNDSVKYHRKQLFNLCFVEGIRDAESNTYANWILNEISTYIH